MIVLQTILELLIMILIEVTVIVIGYYIWGKLLIYYRRWEYKRFLQKQEKDYEKYLQQQREKELHQQEQEKYPLFYWKELTDGNG